MKNSLLAIFMVFTLFSGCKKEGLDGKNSLVDLVIEPTGENCSSGGYKVVSGIDLNNNDALDENEIQNTKYICNGDDGSNGTNSLLNAIPESAGENCSSGGYKVISGIDLNSNNTLDDNEIQNTEFICNGDDGINGNNSLLNVIPEPAGENCSSGGYKVVSGIDINNNSTLDESEIQNTEYVCNGENGLYEKQLTFKLFDAVSSPNGGKLETIHEYTEGYGGVVKFNINNYYEIDSAILVVYDITTRNNYNGNLVSETLTIELYDCRNSQIINNSEIVSGEIIKGSYATSKNIVDDFPDQEIELGVKLTKSADYYASTKDIVLIFYRK